MATFWRPFDDNEEGENEYLPITNEGKNEDSFKEINFARSKMPFDYL